MEAFHNAYRSDRPEALHDDVLLERIRRDKQELGSEEHETDRRKLETALAELELEALKRGLR